MQSQPYNILNLGQNIFFEGDTYLWAGAGVWNLPFDIFQSTQNSGFLKMEGCPTSHHGSASMRTGWFGIHDKTETSGPCLDDLRKAQRLPRASTNCCAPKLGRLGPDRETQVQWQTRLTPWVSTSRQRFNSWCIHGYSVWLYNCYCKLCLIIDWLFLMVFSQMLREFPNSVTFWTGYQAGHRRDGRRACTLEVPLPRPLNGKCSRNSHINLTSTQHVNYHSSSQNSKLHGDWSKPFKTSQLPHLGE